MEDLQNFAFLQSFYLNFQVKWKVLKGFLYTS